MRVDLSRAHGTWIRYQYQGCRCRLCVAAGKEHRASIPSSKHLEHQRRYLERHPEREAERMARYREENREKIRQRKREFYQRHRKEELARHREYKSANKHKVAAQSRLKEAVQDGRIKRQPCEECGALKTHGHHDDYSRPLDVRWLCSICHARVHAKARAEEASHGSK